MQITNISDAKASLSALIKQIQETKQPIIIGKAGKPVAVLSAFQQNTLPRSLGGSWEGNIEIADDFDEPMDLESDFYSSQLSPQQR